MSIIGLDGKPIDLKALTAHPRRYQVEGVDMITQATPETQLGKAMTEAQRAIGGQAMQQMLAQGVSQADAATRAQAAASNVRSPFHMEPCAEAVFMLLAREIRKRDAVIDDLYARLNEAREMLDLERAERIPPEALDRLAAPVVNDPTKS